MRAAEMLTNFAAAFSCVVILHSPGGGELRVDSHHISVFQPLPPNYGQHVAPGTKTIVHAGNQKFAVMETVEEIDALLLNCDSE